MTDLTMPPGFAPVHNRYVLPSFVERTSYGIKESNPYNKLFEDRIIFLGVQIDDASANDVMAQLLTLEGTDPDRDIIMYINSPGGSFTAMTAIYDTMQYVRPDIQTVCLGQAASVAPSRTSRSRRSCSAGTSARWPSSSPGTPARRSSGSRPTSTATAGSPRRRPRSTASWTT